MTANFAPILDPTKVEGRRIMAWSIDLAIFLALVFGVLFATGGIGWSTKTFDSSQQAIDYCQKFDGSNTSKGCVPVNTDAWIIDVRGSADGVWVFNFVLYVLIQGFTGASFGKLAMGLRVVDADGNLAGLRKSFVRTIMWIVDAITCGIPLVGGVAMVSSKGHRRVGDTVAGTFVVAKASVGTPIVLPAAPIPYGYAYPPQAYGPPPGYSPPPGDPSAAWQPPPPGWTPQPQQPPVPPPYVGPAAPFSSRPSIVPPETDGPHWDEDRDTYIQYDRAVEAWVQWDDTANIWRPIET